MRAYRPPNSKSQMDSFKVAIVQWSPVHLNLNASIEKAGQAIKEAARNGASLVVFGETWFSGYPAWLDYCKDVAHWDHSPMKAVFKKMLKNSLAQGSSECLVLQEMARDHGIGIVLGANEYDLKVGKGTIFNSIFFIDDKGELLNVHRKLVPTYTEKLVHSPGDAVGLQSVRMKNRSISGLVCWEHWMPLSRQALHDSSEEIHIALWPMVHEMHQVASRQYAFEGRCFVLAAGQIFHSSDFPMELEKPQQWADKDRMILNGGSAIIGPDGKYVVEPVFDRETILYADLDIDLVYEEAMNLDVSGHYQRPDVFDYSINRKRKK